MRDTPQCYCWQDHVHEQYPLLFPLPHPELYMLARSALSQSYLQHFVANMQLPMYVMEDS